MLHEHRLYHRHMKPIEIRRYTNVVVFAGAGMSAESGVPTYRGKGGIWQEYNYEDYACQNAFDRSPAKVLDFHEKRRSRVLACTPHAGHQHLQVLQANHASLTVITPNTDGMLQRAGVEVSAELHGSLWRLRCVNHGIRSDDQQGPYERQKCADCGTWLRPDITWFGDAIDSTVFSAAARQIAEADLFISIGTSGAVWPAASFAEQARDAGALMVEINPEKNAASSLHSVIVRRPASIALPILLRSS